MQDVDGLSTTEGLVALGGVALGLVALGIASVSALRLRRLRADQRTVLGAAGERDLVEHAARLERGFVELRDWVEETANGIDTRMASTEDRLDGCVSHRALVRYDAYGEMSGQQSSTLALLDDRRSGVVLSSIHHRDSARVYVKRIVDGEAEIELSPEEREAIDVAVREGPAVRTD